MSLATLYSRATVGIEAPLVTVEVHLANGLPSLSIVGLPEMAVRESKDRVRAAILNSHFEWPSKKVTINLAPADLPKQGGCFDLPIALGILIASEQLQVTNINQYEFLGELALSGNVRPVKGILPSAIACRDADRTLVIPSDSIKQTHFIDQLVCVGIDHILNINNLLNMPHSQPSAVNPQCFKYPDIADVKGQTQAKRALEIAASGGHNLLFSGPPGTGKSMLASRLPGILPPMTQNEALESATVYSVSRMGFNPDQFLQRKYRSPHHTSSAVALVGGGGGSQLNPGEISLAHNGVLFLDELPEFNHKVLEVLREPLESGHINISRAAAQTTFPANFQLIAAMNPCPCGYLGDTTNQTTSCSCTKEKIQRYRSKISGPIMDRIDIHLEVGKLSSEQLLAQSSFSESSETIRQRVIQTHSVAIQRQGCSNSNLDAPQTEKYCTTNDAVKNLLAHAIEKLHLSTRSYHRILRLSRTIADMEGSDNISQEHVAEALSYRQLDRHLI